MADSIKIKASIAEGVCTAKVLVKHVMETGLRKDPKTGQIVPAKFIQEVVCTHNGKNVLNANWGTAISANPYLSFSFSGAKAGDKLSLRWTDNQGESDSAEVALA